jgi:hypothetical protein
MYFNKKYRSWSHRRSWTGSGTFWKVGGESEIKSLWRACNLTAFIHSSTGPVVHLFASRHEGHRFNPRGLLMWNWDSPVSFVLLHWWPWRDWSLWPRLRWALSRTITRQSCWQCDKPTWSHTAFLSHFHARCRSSFRLYNRHSWLLGGGGGGGCVVQGLKVLRL